MKWTADDVRRLDQRGFELVAKYLNEVDEARNMISGAGYGCIGSPIKADEADVAEVLAAAGTYRYIGVEWYFDRPRSATSPHGYVTNCGCADA